MSSFCPDCRSEIKLCMEHQKEQIEIEEKYERGSNEWYLAMKKLEMQYEVS